MLHKKISEWLLNYLNNNKLDLDFIVKNIKFDDLVIILKNYYINEYTFNESGHRG